MRFLAGACAVAVTACLTAAACGSPAGPPPGLSSAGADVAALWPRFSAPKTVLAADASGLRGGDLLAATTLEGVYNAAQHPGRLYLIRTATDRFWLAHLPRDVHTETVPGSLRALLRRFKPDIRGAVVADPANPDTVNLATTLAGLDGAIAIFPAQERLVASLGIGVRYTFDTPAFTAAGPARTYRWGIRNLLPRTSRRLEVAMSPADDGDLRDYAVASRAFVYWLTSTDGTQRPLLNAIIRHTPANTPVMGYLPVENPDVADISALGHFLNGSNNMTNESVWASLPSPASLRQPAEPAPIAARPGTVYVAFLMSDGDNAGFMQSRMEWDWRQPALGAVPAGWTVAPGTVEFDPPMLEYYNRMLPPDSELDAGPSGIGYVSEAAGEDLARFGELTRDIMARDDLKTVDSYEPPGRLRHYAGPDVSKNTPLLARRLGDALVSGQTSGYIDSYGSQSCTIRLQAAAERPGGAPLFLEPMINSYHYGPAELLRLARQLAQAAHAAGVHVVFTTPTELAQTMRRYYAGREAGLPAANTQSRTGEQILARGPAGPAAASGPASGAVPASRDVPAGPNLVTNPSGASGTAGWGDSGGTVKAVPYQGRPAVHWTSHVADQQSWMYYLPALTNGRTYTFSAYVAGSGEVFLNVWNGFSDENTLPVRLTPRYQRLTWTAAIPPGAPARSAVFYAPQLQIRESGAGPVSLYLSGAAIRQSASPCLPADPVYRRVLLTGGRGGGA